MEYVSQANKGGYLGPGFSIQGSDQHLLPESSSHSASKELVMQSGISTLSLMLKGAVPGGLEEHHTETQTQEN